MVGARPARLATTNVTDWKQEQEDPVLYQVAKHLRTPRETFKAALHKVLDRKATAAYVNPSFAFTYIYVTFIFPMEGQFKVYLQFVHSSVLRVYIYV